MRIGQAPKDPDVLDIEPPTSEGLLMSYLPQYPVGAPILQVNCSSTRLCPQVQRQTLIVQHGSRCTGDSPGLPLGNPVLLGVVWYSHLSSNAMLGTEVYKLSKEYSPSLSDRKTLILFPDWFSTKALNSRNRLNTLLLVFKK
jgi:hypothetical protein